MRFIIARSALIFAVSVLIGNVLMRFVPIPGTDETALICNDVWEFPSRWNLSLAEGPKSRDTSKMIDTHVYTASVLIRVLRLRLRA